MSAPAARPSGSGAPSPWPGVRRGAPVLLTAPEETGPGRPPPAGSGWEALTPRELEVVALVTLGATNQQAARRLHLSPHTVNAHLRHVFTKLGVSSRVELTRVAVAREQHGPSHRPAGPPPPRGLAPVPGTPCGTLRGAAGP